METKTKQHRVAKIRAALGDRHLRRKMRFDRAKINEDERTVEVAFSSELVVDSGFYELQTRC